jgi:hypothetical protein
MENNNSMSLSKILFKVVWIFFLLPAVIGNVVARLLSPFMGERTKVVVHGFMALWLALWAGVMIWAC